MRPVELQLQAFGPFAGRVTVDFTALAQAGLYCVSGPTGAGKTSLLDGLCYALYGAVPGSRHHSGLRSDHADVDVATEARLQFLLDGQEWQVVRRPEQPRLKRRGVGTTLQRPTAVLHRRTGDRWSPTCEGVAEVAGAVRDLIGLDAQQFWQVVVLPQGQVQRALQADAHERQRLLSSLFATDRFARATDQLTQRAHTTVAQVELLDAAQAERRASAQLAWQEVIKERPDPGSDECGNVETPGDQEALDALSRSSAETADRLRGDMATAADDAWAARQRLAEARETAAHWRHRAEALAQLARLEAEGSAIEALRERVAVAERGQRCQQELLDVERAAADAAGAKADLGRLLRRLPVLSRPGARQVDDHLTALRTADAGDPGLPHALDVARQAVDARRRDVAVQLDRARAAGRADEQARVQRERLQRARDVAAAAQSDVDALRADLDDAGRAEERALDALRRLPGLTEECARARATLEAARTLVDLDGRRADLDARLREAEHQHNRARGTALDLREEQLAVVAARLAHDLQHGCACPVCGSCEHPHPADVERQVPEADVAEAEALADRWQSEVDGLRRRLDAVHHGLHAAEQVTASRDVHALAGRHARVLSTHRQATRSADELATVQHRCDEQRRALQARHGALRTAGAEAEAARTAAERYAQEAAATRAQIGRALGGNDDAAGLATALDEVVGALEQVGASLAQTLLASREHAAAARRLDGRLREAGFPDVATLRTALGGAAPAATMREQIRRHEGALTETSSVLALPELRALADVPPDEESAGRRAEQAERAAADAVARHATVAAAARTLQRVADEHREAERRLRPQRAAARRLTGLAELCRGTGGNQLRMSLERYVLAAYLEEITDRASLRLLDMTAGRYRLTHTGERARGNRASGLDLRVVDSWTGVQREVGTLSGGETFQASLALALALADTVRAHSGGLELDTLFVDEGFGALDPDALDTALDELDRLREGGRMVGVISHVPGLADRVTTEVQVTRGRHGSTVAVRSPEGVPS